MFVPTSMYPEIWWTPGVVSQTPESFTNLSFVSFWTCDSKTLCERLVCELAYATELAKSPTRTKNTQARSPSIVENKLGGRDLGTPVKRRTARQLYTRVQKGWLLATSHETGWVKQVHTSTTKRKGIRREHWQSRWGLLPR
jgi:hypothetical protein